MTEWQGVLSREFYQEFENALVVVLGGGNGIGAAMVDAFHWLGARVALVDRDERAAITRVQELERRVATIGLPIFRAKAFVANLDIEAEREQALDTVLAQLGPPRVLISTLGCDARFDFDTVTQEDLQRLITINGVVPVLASRHLLPSMRAGGGGVVCLFTSRHATEILEPAALGYAGGKAFLEIGIRDLALSVGTSNTNKNIIRVFGFCPGWVQTESQQSRFSRQAFEDAISNQLVPLETYAEDLVPSVVHLCSKRACRFSGRIHREDAGEVNLRAATEELAGRQTSEVVAADRRRESVRSSSRKWGKRSY